MTTAPATVGGAFPLQFRRKRAAAVLGAALTAVVAFRFGTGADALLAAAITVVLVVLALIDVEQRRIPNVIVLPAACVTLVGHIAIAPDRSLEWVLGALGTALFLLVPAVLTPGSVGMGDVKLGLLLGAAFGLATPVVLVFAGFASLPLALIFVAREGRAGRKRAIPFGPFLAAGAIVTLLLSGPAAFS
jgi:leader peptidase (prepilin peptidase) / N-methyltransferase